MHLKRVLSVVLLLPPLLLLIAFGTPFHFFLLLSVAIVMSLYEFYRMVHAWGVRPLKALGILGGWGLSFSLFQGDGREASLVMALLTMATLIVLLLAREPKEALERAAVTLFGVLYVAGLLSFSSLLRAMPGGKGYIFYLLLIVWAGDTGALYVGKGLGRRRLCPSISPHKTAEGLLGGLACSLLASLLAKGWVVKDLSYTQCLGLGLLLGLLGQAGDLCESLLKRSMGAKDSGTLIPGHGGLLDVIDSLLFAAPALYLYLTLARG